MHNNQDKLTKKNVMNVSFSFSQRGSSSAFNLISVRNHEEKLRNLRPGEVFTPNLLKKTVILKKNIILQTK